MKKPIKIFVEGVADKKFIYDYLCHLYGKNYIQKNNIISANGKDKLHLIINQFYKNTNDEGTNLVIFDADDSDFEETRMKLKQFKLDLAIKFESFLFPNHKDTGTLENLLEKIINQEHKAIFDCWENYEKCLQRQEKNYTVPAKKTKIYGYMEAILGASKKEKQNIKEINRNYQDSRHWDLHSPYLESLKQFLEPYFIE